MEYTPWRTSSVSSKIVGLQSVVNPTMANPISFRDVDAVTEISGGTQYAPEDTAQTSPATVQLKLRARTHPECTELYGRANKMLRRAVMVNGAGQQLSLLQMKTTASAIQADAEDAPELRATHVMSAIVLVPAFDSHSKTLVSVMPAEPREINNVLHHLLNDDTPAVVGVLLSVVEDKPSKCVHLVLAVEHAVQMQIDDTLLPPFSVANGNCLLFYPTNEST